ncbi:MAG: hypothetical protein KDJ75_04420 [Alphaproteobacteria bacterium]|nr:hypothetical protein [Alphaproteobacteria bacterium]
MKTQKYDLQLTGQAKGRSISLLALALALTAGGCLFFTAPALAQQATTPQKYCEQLEVEEGPGTCEFLGFQVAPGWAVNLAPGVPQIQKTAVLVEQCLNGDYEVRAMAVPQTSSNFGGITQWNLGGQVVVCP